VFVTLKFCVDAWSRTTCPKLPKLGVADMSNARIAPLGSSLSVIECGDVSASVWMERVAVIGLRDETLGTAGASIVTVYEPPAGMEFPWAAVVKPAVPVMVAVVMVEATSPVLVNVKDWAAGGRPPQSLDPKSIDAVGHPEICPCPTAPEYEIDDTLVPQVTPVTETVDVADAVVAVELLGVNPAVTRRLSPCDTVAVAPPPWAVSVNCESVG
jgi:hypothetical protein